MCKGRYTKAALAVIAVMLAVSLNGQTNRAAQKPPSLDEEAQAVARRIWNRRLAKCGDSFYAYTYIEKTKRGGAIEHIDVRIGSDLRPDFAEYKSVSFSVLGVTGAAQGSSSGSNLSPATKLNGFEWIGSVWPAVIFANRTRSRHSSDGQWGQWPETWTDTGKYEFTVALAKKGGQWFVGFPDDLDGSPLIPVNEELSKAQPSCADLPLR